MSGEQTTAWWRAWTGNSDAECPFKVFARTGDGGLAAFWLVRSGQPDSAQPIVYLGSEGDASVAAHDLDDLLWLLAAGYHPSNGCGRLM